MKTYKYDVDIDRVREEMANPEFSESLIEDLKSKELQESVTSLFFNDQLIGQRKKRSTTDPDCSGKGTEEDD